MHDHRPWAGDKACGCGGAGMPCPSYNVPDSDKRPRLPAVEPEVDDTLPPLLRIALVFGVGLEHFLIESAERPSVVITRKNDRLRLPVVQVVKCRPNLFESLDFPVTDRKMEAFYAEFPVQSKPSEPHQHAGAS